MDNNNQNYWQSNTRLLLILLSIWFTVSFLFGILVVDQLNKIQFFGFKFGFWWAQQGSIYVFIALIFIYANRMKKIDKKFGVSEDEDNE